MVRPGRGPLTLVEPPMLKDLSGIGTLQDALTRTNELLEQVLEELRKTNDVRLEAVVQELRKQD